jgi:GAF domain-containing protein
MVCNSIAKGFLPASALRQEAMRRGLKSMAMCPLRAGGAVCAVLTLLAREADAFGEDELKLLRQLSAGLSAALARSQRAAV